MSYPYRLASIPLVQIGHDGSPAGYASSCVIRYKGHLFLLTVAHATQNDGDWAMEIGYQPELGTKLYRLGTMNFIAKGRVKKRKFRAIDFSYRLLSEPVYPLHQTVNEDGTIAAEGPKLVLSSDLSATPIKEQSYGFWGLTHPRPDGRYLRRQPKLELGMRYIKSDGDYHEFEIQRPYKNIEDYRGCSGAPILDETGTLVSLVVEGNKRKTGIFGLNLTMYKVALDAQLLAEQA